MTLPICLYDDMALCKKTKKKHKIKNIILERDGYVCCFCEKNLNFSQITLDHIVPNSQGGDFNITNLTVACQKCNVTRNTQPFFEYCKKFNFSSNKINKYKIICENNNKIKMLNIAKEKILKKDFAVPAELLNEASKQLNIDIDINQLSSQYLFDFNQILKRKQIKYYFENLIKTIQQEKMEIK